MKSVHSKVPVALLVLVSIVFSQSPISALALQSKQNEAAIESKCTKYKFIGMRGSGQGYEGPSEMEALGPEMASLYGRLKTITELKGQISYSGIKSYPAVAVPSKEQEIPAFLTSLGDIGTIELIKDYARELKMCPDTKFIIAGYSQGAYAAHYLLDQIQSHKSYLRDSIVGVILLANPTQDNTGIVSILKDNTKITKNFKIFLSIILEGIGSSYSLSLEKALSEEYNIDPPDPAFLKTMSYYQPSDVIADTSKFLYDVRLELAAYAANKILNPIPGVKDVTRTILEKKIKGKFKTSSAIHSGYCAKSGIFAPKDAGKLQTCNEKANKDFLARSEKYIKGQLDILKRLDYQRRQNVLNWYGNDWQVPTNCQQIMNQSFSKLQKDMAVEFEDFGGLRILAINLNEPSIWFVDQEDLELVSYTPEDGFYSLETFEKLEQLLETLESFDRVFSSLSKSGIISNLVFEPEDDWRCKFDIGISD